MSEKFKKEIAIVVIIAALIMFISAIIYHTIKEGRSLWMAVPPIFLALVPGILYIIKFWSSIPKE